MLYRFRYLDDDRLIDSRVDDLEFACDEEAIKATDDGVRCMISDRMKHRLPMQPMSVVEVSDCSGRVVHQIAIADLLRQALQTEAKP